MPNYQDKLLEAEEEEEFDNNEKQFDDDESYFFKEESDVEDLKEESVAMDLDYDHLMAYFDSLKESSAQGDQQKAFRFVSIEWGFR